MKITADASKCVGAGQCVLTEPKVFDQSENDGAVIVLNARPEGELLMQRPVGPSVTARARPFRWPIELIWPRALYLSKAAMVCTAIE